MNKVIAFFNTDLGRRIVKGGTVAIGALVSSGTIPVDMPVAFGLSLGQILIFLGIITPTGQMNTVRK